MSSDNFTDEDLGGSSFGLIQDRGDRDFVISAISLTSGIYVLVSGGASPAFVEACGLTETTIEIPSGGSEFSVLCNSLDVTFFDGSVMIIIGDNIVVTASDGAVVIVTEISEA